MTIDRGVFTRQTGTTDPEHKVSKGPRPSPGKTPGNALGEDDASPAAPDTDRGRASAYDETAEAGITHAPPPEEKHQQEELPPRGARKKSYHA